jgi:hypothetical protein
MPTQRESGLFALIGWFTAVWSLGFAINVVLAADYLTSPQWRSLMTVPGGKWFWTALFGSAGILLLIGLLGTHYRLRACGFALSGAGCGFVAVFYLIAPLFHLGPITFGYWPWFLGVGIGLLFSVMNWSPIQWP